ncbi:hypothetical protein D9M70_589430 [compost metagenome]
MVASPLQQRLDLGETGVEVNAGERRLAFGHQPFQQQFRDGFADFLGGHMVDGVFQLTDVWHGLLLLVLTTVVDPSRTAFRRCP